MRRSGTAFPPSLDADNAPGAVFDNLRVLHGRSSYTGTRRLCGAYVNGDDYRSRLRGLQKQFGEDPRRKALQELLKSRYGVSFVDKEKGGAWEDY